MITIDGSLGEGGGQVLRTSLSLSMITGEQLRVVNIRAKRKKPGLMRQHLTAVQAAAALCAATMTGDEVGSREIEFKPGKIKHGNHSFAIGTAGSSTLVLQTILPALLQIDGSSLVTLEGGTHNPLAPPYDFLENAFLPLLARMGAKITPWLHRHGFYPAGGGKITVDIEGGALKPLTLTTRKGEPEVKATCVYSVLPSSIAKREAQQLNALLPGLDGKAEVRRVDSAGPGNAVIVMVETDGHCGTVCEVFTGFGEKGVTSEEVATAVAREATEYIASGAAVGKHLADQLLLPLALAGGGEFTTLEPSQHVLTNIEVIHAFLPIRFSVKKVKDGLYAISC